MSNKENNTCPALKTKVGGQALIEGVMMLGPKKGCMAVRKPDKTIYTEEWTLKGKKWYNKAPFIRGCFNFVGQLKDGYKYINKSGEISGMFDEDEPEKDKKKKTEQEAVEPAEAVETTEVTETAEPVTEKTENTEKPEKEKSDPMTTVIMVISSILGIAMAVFLFMMLPTFIFTGIQYLCGDTDISMFRSLIEGVLKIGIFLFYMWLTSLMKTMKRLYMYHGAEHKTIFCYENRLPLTVENVRKFKRFHPRCGTSFIFLTLAISILVYSILPINSELFVNSFGVSQFVGDLLRIACKLVFLPVVVGIAYELIRIAGRYNNLFTRIISAPGLAVQRLTTKEPEDDMIEIAIASMLPVLPENPDDAKW
ncbi:MAG: DUF1385 domain-containing protein [Eubacterium sp.]|nr:DUF1385 domain-containing protein [Eubacterium sp.]